MSQYFANDAPDSICVVRLSAIGDTCHALAVVRTLQDNWPAANITWIIGRTEAALMGDIPDVEFITFDKRKGRAAYADVRQQLSGSSFDVALCMHASMRANLLCRHIPAPIKLGFDRARARDFQWLFTNRRIEAADGEHALEAMMRFAKTIGARDLPLRWDIPLHDAHREFAKQFTPDDRPTLLISPCSSQRTRNFRNWRVENYIAVVRHAERQHGCRVILTGGGSDLEHEYAASIAADPQSDALDLVGKTDLKELLALIAAADLLVCPDSGPAHMATAVGTAVVGLYATSNPDRTGPYRSRSLTVNRYPDAVATYLGKSLSQLRWGQRVRHPDAMNLVTIGDVTDKIDDFFGR